MSIEKSMQTTFNIIARRQESDKLPVMWKVYANSVELVILP